MSEAIDVLLANLDEAYERRSWHGTNLRGSIRGLTAAESLWRPAPGRLNIWELVAHAAYWKYAIRRKLTGEKRGTFPLKGSNLFRSDACPWPEVVRILDAEHRLLRSAVASLPRIDEKRRHLIAGVTAHDLYHTGQIQLVKRLMRA